MHGCKKPPEKTKLKLVDWILLSKVWAFLTLLECCKTASIVMLMSCQNPNPN